MVIAPKLNESSYLKWAATKWGPIYIARLALFDIIHGELTTRTDDNTGVITVVSASNGGHGITTSETVAVFFDDGTTSGEIKGMPVSAVTNKAITVDGGSGEVLPAVNSLVTLKVVGAQSTILPMGDPHHGLPDAATFNTVGEEQVVFTWSESWRAFNGHDALADSLTFPYRFQGIIPIIDFNGTDEEADSPDAAYWSRAGAPFSVGAWINLRDSTNSAILSKFDNAGNTREWVFGSNATDHMTLFLFDENVAENPSIDTTVDATLPEGVWIHCVATYDGTANASGINIYADGALDVSTDTDDANFLSLEDLGGTMKLAHVNAIPGTIFDGLMAGGPLGPFFIPRELTADEVARDYDMGRKALGL